MRAPGTLKARACVFRILMDAIEGVELTVVSYEFELVGKLDPDTGFVITALGPGESEVKDPFSLVLEGAIDRAIAIHEEWSADMVLIGIPAIDRTSRNSGMAVGGGAGRPALGAMPDNIFFRLFLRVPLPP